MELNGTNEQQVLFLITQMGKVPPLNSIAGVIMTVPSNLEAL